MTSNLNFMQCLQSICCCFNWGEPIQTRPSPPPRRKKSKPKKAARPNRLHTKYAAHQVAILSDEERRAEGVVAYCCPICTLHFNRILACCDCANTICLACFSDYDRKNIADDTVLKCPFCSSPTSMFADYELEPHSYFDTTHKGFLSKEERDKLDAEVPIAELSPNQESGAEMESSNSQVAGGV